jgi:hypothetical protein
MVLLCRRAILRGGPAGWAAIEKIAAELRERAAELASLI